MSMCSDRDFFLRLKAGAISRLETDARTGEIIREKCVQSLAFAYT